MKQLPFSIISENTIIGSILFNPEKIHDVLGVVNTKDFFDPNNQTIYSVLCDFQTAGKPLRLDEIQEYIKNKSIIINPMAWLEWEAALAVDLEPYIKTIKNEAKMRRLMQALLYAQTKVATLDPLKPDHDGIFTDIEKILNETVHNTITEPITIGVAGKEFVYRATQREGYDSIKTGYETFDAMTGGLKRGHFIVMAGMPSHGKTAFALNIARNVAHMGKKVGILSLEQPSAEIFGRLASQESDIPYTYLEQHLNKYMVQAYPHMQALGELPIYIEDFKAKPSTINQVKSSARFMKKKWDVDLIVVDYLGRISSSKHRETKAVEIGEISNELKSLALELNIPLVTICQINRENIKRPDPTPKGYDLRDSGTIEYDADELFMVYYEYKIHKDNPLKQDSVDRNRIKVIIDKQRNGPLGAIEFDFDGPCMKFRSIAGQNYDESMYNL